jgi:hypothetical protein
MFEEVLAFQDKFTVCVGAGVPVPVRDSVVVAGWPLLVKLSEALADPATWGLKVTENEVLCPTGIVIGSERPPTLKTELPVFAAFTVTFAPLAVSVPDAVRLVPTTTLPRPRVEGVTVNIPAVVVPVPDKAMLNAGFVASEVIVRLPLTPPDDFGAKETSMLALCPAPKLTGADIPLKLNPAPLIVT